MKIFTNTKGSFKSLYWYVIICLYYYSYRYILQYNSTSTSPTYRDTPTLLKLAKYIFFVILILSTVLTKRGKIQYQVKHRDAFYVTLLLTIQMTTIGVLTFSTDALQFAIALIFLLFSYKQSQTVDISSVKEILMLFWIYSAVYEAIQLILYFTTGRLPALAYAGGNFFSVRFGGALDDPNGYGVLLIFYIYYSIFEYTGRKRTFLLAANLIMLILTWSGTAVLALMGTSAIMLLLLANSSRIMNTYFKIITCLLLIGIVVFILYGSEIVDYINIFISAKRGSVNGHLDSWDLSKVSLLSYLGIFPDHSGGEVGHIRLLKLGGVPALAAFWFISLKSIFKLKYIIKHTQASNKPVFISMLAYLVAFMLGMFNLSFIITAYCMGLYVFCVAVAFSYYPRGDRRP